MLALPKKGLEPLLLLELEPKPSMSTNFHHFGCNSIKERFYSLPDLNRYSKNVESDFKSDVSTNFTKRVFVKKVYIKCMAQFDIMISFSLLFNLLLVLYIYYFYNIKEVIPYYVETKKFRSKIFSALNNVKNITSSGSYILVLDFKYFKGFV